MSSLGIVGLLLSKIRKHQHVMVVLGAIVAAFLLYLPSELGAALTIPPDSSEYAICLDNLFRHGTFGFTLNGEWYPSRYSPWFSLTCLTPAYLLSGGNPLCMHWSILAFAIAVLIFLGLMGSCMGLRFGAVLAPIVVMFLPDFVFYSRVVMTEIPYAAVHLALAIVFARVIEENKVSLRFILLTGILIAWCGMIRPSGLMLLIPFSVSLMFKRGACVEKLKAQVMLGAPACIYQIVNLCYNRLIFGSPFRSGYHYWMPVPCDFPELLFNWSYVLPACRTLFAQPVMQISFVMGVVVFAFSIAVLCGSIGGLSQHKQFLSFALFIFYHLLVLLALYLGYYWVDTRFFLSVTIALIPLFLYSVWMVTLRLSSLFGRISVMSIALLAVFVFLKAPTRYLYMTVSRPLCVAAAYVSGVALPENSVVIQNGDPNVMEHFGLRFKAIRLLPFQRKCDYVSHMIAPKSIEHCSPKPRDAYDKYIPQLIEQGTCLQPYPKTLLEDPNVVYNELNNGKRVFYQWLSLFGSKEFDVVADKMKQIGLSIKESSAWQLPAISPNPIRHFYDRLVFQQGDMDSRPEACIVYYEVYR